MSRLKKIIYYTLYRLFKILYFFQFFGKNISQHTVTFSLKGKNRIEVVINTKISGLGMEDP